MAEARPGNRRRSVLFLIVLTAVTLVTLDSRAGDSGPLGAIGRVAHQIVDPVARLSDKVMSPVQDWFSGLLDAGTLREENKDLRREVARMKGREAEFDAAIETSELLQALNGFPYLDAIDSKAGRVIQVETGNYEHTVTLDIGSDDGVQPRMPVVGDGGLVGKVLESWPSGCKVLLMVDDRFGVGVRLAQVPQVFSIGFADGVRGSEDLSVQFILDTTVEKDLARTGDAVIEGDGVVTSGLDTSEFPPNIPVGQVSKVQYGAQDLSLRVRITPFVDFGSLQYVRVLLWTSNEDNVVIPADLANFELPPNPARTTTTTTTTTIPGDSSSTDSSTETSSTETSAP